MERNARLDAEQVDVQTKNGPVTLRRTVNSWADNDQAVSAGEGDVLLTRARLRITV